MGSQVSSVVASTSYDRSSCDVGVVHIGFGAFHRAHQAVFIDDYMSVTGDLRWGIAAVNLRGSESVQFKTAIEDIERHDGYYLQSISGDGSIEMRLVRSHVHFSDWEHEAIATEAMLAKPSVKLVTITVTESGYYTGSDGNLNIDDPLISDELAGHSANSVYAYLRAALRARQSEIDTPLTIACCDNIRRNGKMLKRNLHSYLVACDDHTLAEWVTRNVAFPCSMVDRITPRSPEELNTEISKLSGTKVTSAIMAEDFMQWVLEDIAAGDMPELDRANVTVTADIDPYEETKIRVLNGGHTALTYLAALEGIETFDAAMRVDHLYAHFRAFETQEVLPALNMPLPFSKDDYLESIDSRFRNQAIGDTVARICADGMAKFPIFIRPTLQGCLEQGITPTYAIRSIASWYVFARHVDAGNIPFDYIDPSWDDLKSMLGTDEFVTSVRLWADLPTGYPVFAETLRKEITELEAKWPV